MNQDISLASLILAQQLNGGSWGAFSWETIHMLSWETIHMLSSVRLSKCSFHRVSL